MAYHRANAAWVSAFSYLTVLVATFYSSVQRDTRDFGLVGGVLIAGSGVALVIIAPSGEAES